MLAEVLRRKKTARLPRFLAATVQTPWTAFWLGSLFYAILRAGWTVVHLGPAPMPVWLPPPPPPPPAPRAPPPRPALWPGRGAAPLPAPPPPRGVRRACPPPL